MKYIIILLLFLSTPAMAAGYQINWIIPAARVDNTLLTLDEILKYEVWVNDELVMDNIGNTDTNVTVTVGYGQSCIKMRTTDTEGRIGPFSDASCVNLVAPPSAPVITSIEYVE